MSDWTVDPYMDINRGAGEVDVNNTYRCSSCTTTLACWTLPSDWSSIPRRNGAPIHLCRSCSEDIAKSIDGVLKEENPTSTIRELVESMTEPGEGDPCDE